MSLGPTEESEESSPDRIEVKEEEHGDAQEVADQQDPALRSQLISDLSQDESKRQDHEDESSEHVIHEQNAADQRPRQPLRYEPEQDDGRGKAAVPDDEIRQGSHTGQARPPDPRVAERN